MKQFSTGQVADSAGIHKDTLLRWLRSGKVPEPPRDSRGWRVFSDDQVKNVVEYSIGRGDYANFGRGRSPRSESLIRLQSLDWDFTDAKTTYLTHGLHPYPAKFIPQIPNALIQELSSVGDTVLDCFCGSGTTLVEALLLKRNAVGIDANPLACLVSQAKTSRLDDDALGELNRMAGVLARFLADLIPDQLPLFKPPDELRNIEVPNDEKISFWFEPFVIEELAIIRHLCRNLESTLAKNWALATFSSIIVSVSKQDSDTRYVRREKNLVPGSTLARFQAALRRSIQRAAEFREVTDPSHKCRVINANVLDFKERLHADLVVCSPPYPNAYSYHLYHMTRMLWLGMDYQIFKKDEIGSHRKYSSRGKNRATVETFKNELAVILGRLQSGLKTGGYACVVIGDSTIDGRTIRNDSLLIDAAAKSGFSLEANIDRKIQRTRKAFNPKIGKIKTEHIVILRNGA